MLKGMKRRHAVLLPVLLLIVFAVGCGPRGAPPDPNSGQAGGGSTSPAAVVTNEAGRQIFPLTVRNLSQETSGANVVISGEIVNQTGTERSFVQVRCRFFDQAGTTLSPGILTTTPPARLTPNQVIPFRCSRDATGVARYEVEAWADR
jgi:hypothetical protein